MDTQQRWVLGRSRVLALLVHAARHHGATEIVSRRVEALDSALVPAMVEAARSAFLSARFLPGERSGQAVRTRMEVEVDFDAGP